MHQLAGVLEQPDQGGVGLLDVLAGDLGHLVGEFALGVHRVDQRLDPGGLEGV